MSQSQDRLAQLAADITAMAGELSSALAGSLVLQQSVDAQQATIAVRDATISQMMAALVAVQTRLAADEAILAAYPPPAAFPAGHLSLGAFLGGWNDTGLPAALAAYEAALGASVALINAYNGENAVWTGPNSIVGAAGWMLSLPGKSIAAPPRRLAYSLHLGLTTPPAGMTQAQYDKANFAEIAAGQHDDVYATVGHALVNNGFANAVIRLGLECSGEWFPGCAKSDPVGFVAAWNHIAGVLKAISPAFAIVLDFTIDRPIGAYVVGIDWSLVAGINLDIYDDTWFGTTPEARWSYVLGHGINEWLALGAAKGKPLLILEWGVGKAGDNPYMVTQIAALAKAPANNIVALAYWQSSSNYPATLSAASNPNAWREYCLQFGVPLPPLPVMATTVRLTGWPGGGNVAPTFELFVAGVSQGAKQMPSGSNAVEWSGLATIAAGAALSAKMTGGSWYALGNCKITDASGVRNFGFGPSGVVFSSGDTKGWAAP